MPAAKKAAPSNPDVLLARIKKTFPDISWTAYQYIDEGWDHEVVILDNRLVFRFPNDPDYLALLKTEVGVLHELGPLITSVNIPHYTYVAPDYSFAGYRFLAGDVLTEHYFNGLPATDQDIAARKLAEFLSVMHSAIFNGRDFSVVPASSMAGTLPEDRLLADRYLKPVLPPEDYRTVLAILDDTAAALSKDAPVVLLHGDVYSTHLLWNAGAQELGIIDFSDMNRGDPAFDFAELYEYGGNFVEKVYGYYTAQKDDGLLSRARIYQKWVGVFMMVDHFIHHKTTFKKACRTFERTKHL
jgi:aminoglycoside 2''-phosphotransferase